MEDPGKKQVDALEKLKPEEQKIVSQELQLYLMILLTKEKN